MWEKDVIPWPQILSDTNKGWGEPSNRILGKILPPAPLALPPWTLGQLKLKKMMFFCILGFPKHIIGQLEGNFSFGNKLIKTWGWQTPPPPPPWLGQNPKFFSNKIRLKAPLRVKLLASCDLCHFLFFILFKETVPTYASRWSAQVFPASAPSSLRRKSNGIAANLFPSKLLTIF